LLAWRRWGCSSCGSALLWAMKIFSPHRTLILVLWLHRSPRSTRTTTKPPAPSPTRRLLTAQRRTAKKSSSPTASVTACATTSCATGTTATATTTEASATPTSPAPTTEGMSPGAQAASPVSSGRRSGPTSTRTLWRTTPTRGSEGTTAAAIRTQRTAARGHGVSWTATRRCGSTATSARRARSRARSRTRSSCTT